MGIGTKRLLNVGQPLGREGRRVEQLVPTATA
jgi:hypothetical protein